MKKIMLLVGLLFVLAFGVKSNACEKELNKDELFLEAINLAFEYDEDAKGCKLECIKLQNGDYFCVVYDSENAIKDSGTLEIGDMSYEEVRELYDEVVQEIKETQNNQ